MEEKFTPGPWVHKRSPFEVYNVDHGALETHIVSNDIMICAMYPREANAHLISAAPDMYEALSILFDWITDNLIQKMPTEQRPSAKEISEKLKPALQAFQKARGEQ